MTQADRVFSTPPTNTSLTRRGALGAIAAATAVTVAGALPTAAPAMDFPVAPVVTQGARTAAIEASAALQAVERYRKASRLFDRRSMKFSDARDLAQETHGNQPLALIRWRNYSHTGGSELKGARESFLLLGEDPATIETEYRDAKKRYRAALKAEKAWEKRAGIDGLAESMEQARAELYAAREALGTVKVDSVADASALLEAIRPKVKPGDIVDWEVAALNNASKYLAATVAATA